MAKDKLNILFFYAGNVPTLKETIQYEGIGYPMGKRNASVAFEAEICDGVVGTIPDCYAGYPDGVAVIEKFKADRLKRLSDLGEDETPTRPSAAAVPVTASKDAPKAANVPATEARVPWIPGQSNS